MDALTGHYVGTYGTPDGQDPLYVRYRATRDALNRVKVIPLDNGPIEAWDTELRAHCRAMEEAFDDYLSICPPSPRTARRRLP